MNICATGKAIGPIVDAHMHLWHLEAHYHPWLCDEPAPVLRYGDYTPLRRNFLPDDYRRESAGLQVRHTVYVEAEWDPQDPIGETRWVHELAESAGIPTVMVAQALLDRDDVEHTLARQAAFERVRGIRHKPRATLRPSGSGAATGSMSDRQWRDGFALLERHGLSFDLQVPWWHLEEAARLARDFPSVPIAINHAGQIDTRAPEVLAEWRRALERIAREPNVVLKISGLGLAGRSWSLRDNAQIIADAISIFGVDRCMFASNYPVDSLVGSFRTIYEGFWAATSHLGETERRKLLHDNAMRFYRIRD